MTLSRYYSHLLTGKRIYVPTYQEARQDYDDHRGPVMRDVVFRDDRPF